MEAKAAKMHRRCPVDRISELPGFILHMILSVLDTKEACRASVLSKTWYEAWSSIPVLDFRPNYFEGCPYYPSGHETKWFDDEFLQKYLVFIDMAMHRYSLHNHRIRKFHLEFPKFDEELQPLVDTWVGIAVQNQVEELNIKILSGSSAGYTLPEILFSAKSLKVLNCEKVNVPYYETMKLFSLECLTLTPEILNADMLQRMITFCPLTDLDITKAGLGNIYLPWRRKVNEPSGSMQSNVKASTLRIFVHCGLSEYFVWPWKLNVDALRNLRKVEIVCADITDDIVAEMVSGLVRLESLVLNSCLLLRCLKISSISLKEFRIEEGLDLNNIIIDAPNLLKFWYNCEMEASLSLISPLDHCSIHFCPWVESISTSWFVTLKTFLIETIIFKYLVIDMTNCYSRIVVDEDWLKNIVTGPPYKLRELNLLEPCDWRYGESQLTALLDGLFWSCHPDVLLITMNFKTAEFILDILKNKVECWKHPLKSIEVEGADLSTLLLRRSKLEIRFRLSWKSLESEAG